MALMNKEIHPHIPLSMSAQESWGLIVRVLPSRTANPYAMWVHSDVSISEGKYFPRPCLKKKVRILKEIVKYPFN